MCKRKIPVGSRHKNHKHIHTCDLLDIHTDMLFFRKRRQCLFIFRQYIIGIEEWKPYTQNSYSCQNKIITSVYMPGKLWYPSCC